VVKRLHNQLSELSEIVKLEIVEPSNSPYSSPLLVVKINSGTVCLNSFCNWTLPSENLNDAENVYVWLAGPRRPVSEH